MKNLGEKLMMLTKKQILCMILVIILAAVCILPSCGDGDKQNGDTTNNSISANENEEQENDNQQKENENAGDIYKDDVPDMDLGGYNFRALSEQAGWYHGEPNFEAETGEPVEDAIYLRNRVIEERFNIIITETYGAWDKAKPILLSGSDEYDIVRTATPRVLEWLNDGLGLEFSSYGDYIDLNKPYWDANITNELKFGSKNFFAAGALDLALYDYTHMLLFHKQRITDYGLEMPYKLVKSGEWTFDKFNEMMRVAVKDIDGNGVMDVNDSYGFVSMAKHVLPDLRISAKEKSVVHDENNMPMFNLEGNMRFAAIFDKIYESYFKIR
jgi:hypothetical protein